MAHDRRRGRTTGLAAGTILAAACLCASGPAALTGPAVGAELRPATRPADVEADGPAPADHATPAPADADPTPPTPFPNGRPRRGMGGYGSAPPLTAAQRADAVKFFQAHSPLRAKALAAMDAGDRKARLEARVGRAYQMVERARTEAPELYAVAVERIETEDRIFGLAADLHGQSPADQAETVRQLRTQITARYQLNLRERQLRLTRLEQSVAKAKAQLAADSAPAKMDQAIDDRVDQIVADGQGMFGGRHGSGGRTGRDEADEPTPPR